LLHNGAVKSDIHADNTYVYTEIIFGLTDILEFNFGPRIKNFKDQQFYGFNFPKYYHDLDYKLTPKRKINIEKIRDNWDNILRLVITIKERKTTATQILKRLTSYSSSRQQVIWGLKEYKKCNYFMELSLYY
jgi:TnpA family transposase